MAFKNCSVRFADFEINCCCSNNSTCCEICHPPKVTSIIEPYRDVSNERLQLIAKILKEHNSNIEDT